MSRLTLEERRAQLVGVAREIALEQGVEAVTTRAVAARAGVRPGVLHYCFEGKHDLLAAMSLSLVTTANSFLDRVPDVGDLATRLHGYADAMADSLEAREHHQLLAIEIACLAARDPSMATVVGQHMREQWAASERYLGHAVEAVGQRFVAPLADVARMVSAQIDGVQVAWMVDHDLDAARRACHLLADSLLLLAVPDREAALRAVTARTAEQHAQAPLGHLGA